jgi:hypothetical protein
VYDPQSPSLGPRDVLAAWLVCLALIAAVFVCPLLATELHRATPQAQAAVTHTKVCAVGRPLRLPHG